MVIDFEPRLNLEECILSVAGCGVVEKTLSLNKGVYRLVSVKSGSGNVRISGDCVKLCSNDVLFAVPDADVEIISEPGEDMTVNVVGFTLTSRKYSESFRKAVLNGINEQLLVFTNDNISRLLENVSSELDRQKSEYSSELLSLICSQILVYLRRSLQAVATDDEEDELNVRVCSKVMMYIDEHVYEMKNLREVARAIGYNYSYISTLFHNTCGITLNSYFKTKRMNEAKKLLSDSRMSISEIARVMNYSSVYAFSKAFKEHFGSSPGHYSGRFPIK